MLLVNEVWDYHSLTSSKKGLYSEFVNDLAVKEMGIYESFMFYIRSELCSSEPDNGLLQVDSMNFRTKLCSGRAACEPLFCDVLSVYFGRL